MSSSDDAGFIDRIQNFVSDNKRGVIIGAAAAAVAVGGVAYYVASSRGGADSGDEESLKSGEKKSKKKSKKSRKTVKDKDGPILEERKPKVVDVSEEGMCSNWFPLLNSTHLCADEGVLTKEQIETMPEEVWRYHNIFAGVKLTGVNRTE